jgi:hypothetical protein
MRLRFRNFYRDGDFDSCLWLTPRPWTLRRRADRQSPGPSCRKSPPPPPFKSTVSRENETVYCPPPPPLRSTVSRENETVHHTVLYVLYWHIMPTVKVSRFILSKKVFHLFPLGQIFFIYLLKVQCHETMNEHRSLLHRLGLKPKSIKQVELTVFFSSFFKPKNDKLPIVFWPSLILILKFCYGSLLTWTWVKGTVSRDGRLRWAHEAVVYSRPKLIVADPFFCLKIGRL